MSRNAKGSLLLFMAAVFWGSTFAAQEIAAQHYKIGAFTYQSVRMIIGGLVLLPLIFAMKKMSLKAGTYKKPTKADNKQLAIAGVICGAVLCVASCLQQIAISDPNTNSGKIGFITAMYILIVPILYALFGHKISLKVIIAAAMGVVGLYFLSVGVDFSICTGDIYGILCAAMFSVHILVVDKFAPLVDGVKLSSIQFFVCGILAFFPMVFIEKPSIASILECWGPILYAGVFSCGVAYTCQILGQKHTNPTIASLLMSLESVFAVLTGMVVLNQKLTIREYIGCAVMFAAIMISQIPTKKERIRQQTEKSE